MNAKWISQNDLYFSVFQMWNPGKKKSVQILIPEFFNMAVTIDKVINQGVELKKSKQNIQSLLMKHMAQ